MPYSVGMTEFREMSEAQRAEAVSKLVGGAFESENGQAAELDAQIEEYERKYGLPSEHMLRKLAEGEIQETSEICSWLMLLHIREPIGSPQSS
jgi:hypothetical protein